MVVGAAGVCWRRRRVGDVGGRWAIDDLGPDAAGVPWSGAHCPSRLGPAFHLPPTISLKPFGEPWHSTGLAAAYGPFLPAVYHPFVLREAGREPQKGLPEIAYQRSR